MSKVDKKFIVNLKGKDFVTYEGLLDLAHQKGLIGIEVELLQIPGQDNQNTAIAKATAKTEKETFVDIGDASPSSVNNMIKPHIIRMASTRAKARALRDLTNVGMTAFEEIMEDESPQQNYSKSQQAKTQQPKAQQGQARKDSNLEAIKDGSLASDPQLSYIDKLLKGKNYTESSLLAYIEKLYGKNNLKSLTKQEASEVINHLQEVGK